MQKHTNYAKRRSASLQNCIRAVRLIIFCIVKQQRFYNNAKRQMEKSTCLTSQLLTNAKLRDNRTVTVDILLNQIVQQITAAANHFQKSSAGMVVIFMGFQMFRQIVDSFCQNCDLDFRRTGVVFMGAVGIDNRLFFFFQQHYFHLFYQDYSIYFYFQL